MAGTLIQVEDRQREARQAVRRMQKEARERAVNLAAAAAAKAAADALDRGQNPFAPMGPGYAQVSAPGWLVPSFNSGAPA